jgi:hypothetical protein
MRWSQVVAQSIDDLFTAHNQRDNADTKHAARALLALSQLLWTQTLPAAELATQGRGTIGYLWDSHPRQHARLHAKQADTPTHNVWPPPSTDA